MINEKGIISNNQNAPYVAACIICNCQVPVMMYAHRVNNLIVGWVFVCRDHEELIQNCNVILEPTNR